MAKSVEGGCLESGGEHIYIGERGQKLGRKSGKETANRKDSETHKDNLEPVKIDWNLHLSFSASILNGGKDLQEGTLLITQLHESLVQNSGNLKDKLWLDLEELQAKPLPKANTGSRLANGFCEGQ